MLSQNLSKNIYQRTIDSKLIKIIDPVSFLEMIQLEKNASLIMTDSGGVQKEAYFFNKPVLVLRSETEWIEIIKTGTGIICDATENKILESFDKLNQNIDLKFDSIFGDGKAAEYICTKIVENFS